MILLGDSKKLEASCKKIEKVFEKMQHKKISVKKKKWEEKGRKGREPGGIGENTVETYSELIKSLLRDVNNRYGVADASKITQDMVNQIIQERIDSYHAGNTKEASNLKGLAAAIKAFDLGVQETNIFKNKNKFTLADADEIRERLKEQHIYRHSKTSTVLRATPKESISVLENIKASGYDTDIRKMAYSVGKIAMLTGGRVSSILSIKSRAISVHQNQITFVGDKGGLTRTVEVDKATASFLSELKKERDEGQVLFTSKRKNGTFKSIKETRKAISRIIDNAGEHLDRVESVKIRGKDGGHKWVDVKRSFSMHSFRKSFALERTQVYLDKFASRSALDKYVASRIKEIPKLKVKLDTVREKVNASRNTKRDLTKTEYAIFFTSVDLGHFRNDVITAFYTSFKEVQSYYEEKN